MGLSGIGTQQGFVSGYGDADAWGGPQNGIDVMNHIGDVGTPKSYKVPSDVYMFLMIVGAVVTLWLLGGVFFKNARL